MLAKEIKEGGVYWGKVSGRVCRVRVDRIEHSTSYPSRRFATCYRVTNLRTGRRTTFRSARKFRGPADEKPRPRHTVNGPSGKFTTVETSAEPGEVGFSDLALYGRS